MKQVRAIITWTGGIALLAATGIDTLAVVGRHIGLPITGSIELMQATILVAATVGLVIATTERTHARVRILVERLDIRSRRWADRLSDVLTLLFFLSLLIGSGWLAADLWGQHEQSELLGVPWQLLRLFANAGLLACVAILALRVMGRDRR